MSKKPKQSAGRSLARAAKTSAPSQTDFDVVLGLINAARKRAFAAANTELVNLNWQIGEYLSRKIKADGWGKGTVEALADYIQCRQPNARGFSASIRVTSAEKFRRRRKRIQMWRGEIGSLPPFSSTVQPL
jgi:hypothetical protein